MNPIVTSLLALGNTALSIVRDKKQNKTTDDTTLLNVTPEAGISISGKRLLNLIGTPVIIGYALQDMTANGINKMNIIVLACGVLYSGILAVATYLSEKK